MLLINDSEMLPTFRLSKLSNLEPFYKDLDARFTSLKIFLQKFALFFFNLQNSPMKARREQIEIKRIQKSAKYSAVKIIF
jgi:hypothetical protein